MFLVANMKVYHKQLLCTDDNSFSTPFPPYIAHGRGVCSRVCPPACRQNKGGARKFDPTCIHTTMCLLLWLYHKTGEDQKPHNCEPNVSVWCKLPL